MRVIDITLPMHPGMLTYDGDPAFWSHACSTAVQGNPDSYGMTLMTIGSHLGTHVDAPRHFVPGGASVTDLDLAVLCGPARVIDLTAAGHEIDERALRESDLRGVQRLLLKTANERLLGQPFTPHYAHLTPSGARYLRGQSSVKLVGIDYLSIEAYPAEGFPVHHALLDPPAPVVIVEGLDLRGVQAGDYELYCLPLPVRGSDGAPARAVLVGRDA